MSQQTEDLPQITCSDEQLKKIMSFDKNVYAPISNIVFDNTRAAFGIALHMHQPTIPAGVNGRLISNLQFMMENQHIHDNHNAPVFLQCYSRMSDIIRDLVREGRNPRVMLDYSGNLLWGLKEMGEERVLENLKLVTTDRNYLRYVEWLGTTWSHAVATSTPVPDIKLQISAWRVHFASIFGEEAVKRVKGFSAPEMHLPIHPDVCFEYIKALKECGYQWLMVQEHSIENPDGSPIRNPHFPHRLIAKNSLGEIQEITVLIKTQGSDTKLVAQMQPYYEAKTLSPQDYAGRRIPPFVCQIGDGENGGVMMNEFPPAYRQAFGEIGTEGFVAMNGSEYLEFVNQAGASAKDFLPVQPVSQNRIWKEIKGNGHNAANEAIKKVHEKDSRFNLDQGSWTSDKNWVKGYENVLDPMNTLSAKFHERFDNKKADSSDPRYQEALLYLLLSQTSCFRYWGQGAWTDYARDLCERGIRALK